MSNDSKNTACILIAIIELTYSIIPLILPLAIVRFIINNNKVSNLPASINTVGRQVGRQADEIWVDFKILKFSTG